GEIADDLAHAGSAVGGAEHGGGVCGGRVDADGRGRLAGGELVLHHVRAGEEDGVAGGGHRGEERGRGVLGEGDGRHQGAPAAAAGAFGGAGLPGRLLVVVRHEVGRQAYRTVLVLRLGRGNDERPDVGGDGEAALIPHRGQRSHVRVEAEGARDCIGAGRDRV